MDSEGYRNHIVTAIKNVTGQNVIIRGKIKIHLLPLPEVTLSDIFLSDPNMEEGTDNAVVSIHFVEARLGIIALLSGKTELSSVTLVRPIATWQNIRNIRENWNSEGDTTSQNMVATSIENGRIYLGDSRNRDTTIIDNIDMAVEAESASGPFALDGGFIVDNNKFAFNADITASKAMGEGDSTWNFIGDGFQFSFTGDLVGSETAEGNLLSGVIKASSDDFDYVIAKYFQHKQVKPKGKDDKEAPNPFLAQGTLTYSQKRFKIENFTIASDYMNGRGDIRLSMAKAVPEVDISIAFDDINADKFIAPLPADHQYTGAPGEVMTAESFIEQDAVTEDVYEHISRIIGGVSQEFDMLADINIRQLTYNQQQVNKIIFNADVFNGDLAINEFTATLPGNAFLEVTGSIKHNDIRPRFSGEFSLTGDDLRTLLLWVGAPVEEAKESALKKYRLNGDLVLLPQKINLSSIDFGVDKARASGAVIIRYGERAPKIITNLRVSHLDLDEYNLSKPFSQIIAKYYNGDEKDQNSKNFNWLRSMKGHYSGELALDDLVMNETTYKNLFALYSINPGLIQVERLDVDSDKIAFNSALNFDITGIRPKIDWRVDADKIDTAAFMAKDEQKKGDNKEILSAPTSRWSTDKIYFFGLDRFDGKININARSFIHKSVDVSNMTFAARLYEGILGIDALTAEYTGGTANIKGVIGVEDSPNVALSFALNNIEIEKFLGIFSDVKTISGYASLNGSVVTFGDSLADWVKHTKATIAAVGRAVTVSNFGLHDLIEKSEDVTIARQLTKIAEDAAQNGTTLFDSIEAKCQIADGILDFTDMQLATSRTRGIMNGRIDIINGLMNTAGQFAYITVDNAATVNLAFNAVGPVDKPKKTFGLNELFKHKGIVVAPTGKQ